MALTLQWQRLQALALGQQRLQAMALGWQRLQVLAHDHGLIKIHPVAKSTKVRDIILKGMIPLKEMNY